MCTPDFSEHLDRINKMPNKLRSKYSQENVYFIVKAEKINWCGFKNYY